MPLITQDKSNLYGGVSQQDAQSRLQHQVEEMINCFPTLDSGLRMRNPSLPIRLLDIDGILSEPTFPDNYDTVYVYEYDKGEIKAQNNKFVYLVSEKGGLEIVDLNFSITEDDAGVKYLTGRIYRDGQGINYENAQALEYLTYRADKTNFAMTTIKDTVFVANKSISPTMSLIPAKVDTFISKSKTLRAVKQVTVDRNGAISGEVGTITGSNGNFTFTRPSGVQVVDICAVAGGGGGAAYKVTDTAAAHRYAAGGGEAGETLHRSLIVIGETETLTIGAGGVGGSAATNNSNAIGGNGGALLFGSHFTLSGGDGGKFASGAGMLYPAYHGVGQGQSGCGGSGNDGELVWSQNGGHIIQSAGGQSSGFSNGSNGVAVRNPDDIQYSKTFTANGTWVNNGATEVTVCMTGAGGGGYYSERNGNSGGKAGAVYSNTIGVTLGVNLAVVVGVGGKGGDKPTQPTAGTASTFGGQTANGGGGGGWQVDYMGDGAAKSSCGGSANDGTRIVSQSWGGESNGFGDGGNARQSPTLPTLAGVGAGGAGGTPFTSNWSSWNGGRGEVRLTWFAPPSNFNENNAVANNGGWGSGGGGSTVLNLSETAKGGDGGSGKIQIVWQDGSAGEDEPIRNPLSFERRGFIWIKQAEPTYGWRYGARFTIQRGDGLLEYFDIPYTEPIDDNTTVAAEALLESIQAIMGDRVRVTREDSILEIFLTDATERMYDCIANDTFGDTASFGWSHKVDFITDLPKNLGTMSGIVEIGTGDNPKIWVEYREGAWLEHRDPRMLTTIVEQTMPHSINRRYNADADRYEFYVEQFDWNPRHVGDDMTNQKPIFIDNHIKDIFFFRNRLGLMTKDGLTMSEVGYYGNFFRTTVAAVLDSDRIDTGVESTGSVNLEHAILLQDSVILFSDKSQFRFRGGNILSPSNYSIVQEMAHNMNIAVRPILLDNKVFFVANRGIYTAVYEMMLSNDASQNSEAMDLTVQCQYYVDGVIEKLSGSAVHNTLFLVSRIDYADILNPTIKKRNKVFVYKFHDLGRERIQSAWGVWEFSGDISSGFALGSQFYTMINRENLISPAEWILSEGYWRNDRTWLMNEGLWLLSPSSLQRQRQFENIVLHPIREDLPFLDNYNAPVSALIDFGEWVYGTDGERSPRGVLQMRTVEVRMSSLSALNLIVEDVQRNTIRVIPSKYVKGRKPMVMGNSKNMRVKAVASSGQGFRLELVSFEGTISKRARST